MGKTPDQAPQQRNRPAFSFTVDEEVAAKLREMESGFRSLIVNEMLREKWGLGPSDWMMKISGTRMEEP